MRLKSIKLAGFKSFVDPTTVHFPSNMCAVVGPNGCGKSNVIDAVRWVMGESSAKNLRGESMTDVIFNGSGSRQPVGLASVELLFDNSDGTIGGEWASYADLGIKRQVSREGQSEYFLNGTKCRRRDITDIFLGTGLGPRSYAIIEQGTISRLVESKPEELRVFIEEAAGISKYKERRKETESRMRRTVENLDRLTDLRDELGRQLQHLQRQAQSAEKYSEFKKEERRLKSQLLALQWQGLDGQLGDSKRLIGELEVKLESVNAEHQQRDTAIEQLRVEHIEHTDAFNEVQARYYSLGSEVARMEQTIKHQQERGRQLAEDLRQTQSSFVEAEEHLQQDQRQQGDTQAELEQITPELEQLQEIEQASGETLLEAEEAMQVWQSEWDVFNQHAAQPRQQAEVQQSRIQHLEQVLTRVQERIAKLEQEKKALASGPADEENDLLGEEIAEHELVISGHQELAAGLLQQVNNTREHNIEVDSQLNEVRSSLQRMRGRQASLDALQQAARGDNEGVNNWLAQQGLDAKPRLLEQLDVEDGWQRAVETVLADYLQAICVDDINALATVLTSLEQGSVTLMETPTAAGSAVSARSLASKVRGPQGDSPLLAGVYVAEDLLQAMAQRDALQDHESIVTREGLWLGKNWLRVAQLADGEGSAIARQQELETLGASVVAEEARAQHLETQLSAARESLQQLEEQRHAAQNELQQATRKHAELSAELSAKQARVEQIGKRRSDVNAEIDESRQQYQQEQEALAEARKMLSEAIESMEQDSQRREELLSARDDTRTRLDGARQTGRHDKDVAHQLAMRHQSLQTQLEAMSQSIGRTESQLQQLLSRRESLQENLSSNDTPMEGLQQELEQQLEERLKVEAELGTARQKVADIDHKLRESEGQRAAIEHRAQSVRTELEQKRLSSSTLGVQRDNVQRQLSETDQEVDAVLEDMPDNANEPEWQRLLEQAGSRIARLGPINLAAIDEYALQSERKSYLDAQNEDLVTALETLAAAIRKIDKETRTRFRETFDEVNAGLQDLFPRVFGGGRATLEMTGDDLLNTGITIMAQPPGKKNSTIHLLSGGEKALTAIALVFSIFRLNPAPFCMLDEVDAPLDDANVARYVRMVKEMSEKVQFIYITHNKISMEMADQLLGVTMHEPGVSRLVTVDVEEAAELAAS